MPTQRFDAHGIAREPTGVLEQKLKSPLRWSGHVMAKTARGILPELYQVDNFWLGVLMAPDQILDPNGSDPLESRFAGDRLRYDGPDRRCLVCTPSSRSIIHLAIYQHHPENIRGRMQFNGGGLGSNRLGDRALDSRQIGKLLRVDL